MIHCSQVRRSAPGAAGYTLVELMVVMVVLAISASLLLPITERAYSSFKLRLAADSIVRLMQQARSRSLFGSRTCLLIFPAVTARNREIILAREDGSSITHYALPSGISISSRKEDGDWSTDISPLAFFPDGTSEALHLAVKNVSNSVWQIQLDPSTAKAKIVVASDGQP